MVENEKVAPGQKFRTGIVEYEMLRHAGSVEKVRTNQWGRATGGTYMAHRCAVKVNRLHRGWRFSYVAFVPGTTVTIIED